MARAVVSLTLNGQRTEVPTRDERVLLDLLREDLNLVGTKRGCDLGTCGACTVLLDGRPALSCLLLARSAEGRDVVTIEGLGDGRTLTAVQRQFVACGATQCGFCTPGFVLSATALLRETPHPSRSEIARALSGNLCRCTGYSKILDAVEATAREG